MGSNLHVEGANVYFYRTPGPKPCVTQWAPCQYTHIEADLVDTRPKPCVFQQDTSKYSEIEADLVKI